MFIYNFLLSLQGFYNCTLFKIFYTKNNLLNKGIRAWIAAQDQPYEKYVFKRGQCLLKN